MNEDALRKNSILTYELLDEMVDFGYAQSTSTESLKVHVFNDPVTPAATPAAGPGAGKKKVGIFAAATSRTPPASVQKSVMQTEAPGKRRDEIFVDVVEKLNVTFNSSGYLLTSEVDGSIQIRNFLQGKPQIRIALPEDLVIGGREASPFGGDYGMGGGMGVLLDDCNFHEAANLADFETDRTITLNPPDGEFAVMNYRSANDFKPPFRVIPTIDESTPFKVEVVLKVRADFPAKHACTGLVVRFPVPKGAVNATATLESGLPAGTQHAAYNAAERQVVWQFKKVKGGSEHLLSIKISLQEERILNVRKEMGPVNLQFTIPMYNVSKLAVRYLQISTAATAKGGKGPHRWVRYVTKSSSYICRV